MAVFSRVPDLGLSEGNLVCGDMTGQHCEAHFCISLQINVNDDELFSVYIPVNATKGQDIVRLFVMAGTSGFTNQSINMVAI